MEEGKNRHSPPILQQWVRLCIDSCATSDTLNFPARRGVKLAQLGVKTARLATKTVGEGLQNFKSRRRRRSNGGCCLSVLVPDDAGQMGRLAGCE